jgi:hypothetical protein
MSRYRRRIDFRQRLSATTAKTPWIVPSIHAPSQNKYADPRAHEIAKPMKNPGRPGLRAYDASMLVTVIRPNTVRASTNYQRLLTYRYIELRFYEIWPLCFGVPNLRTYLCSPFAGPLNLRQRRRIMSRRGIVQAVTGRYLPHRDTQFARRAESDDCPRGS